MIHHLDDVRGGFDVEADVVVVGSGAGGAVAAANLAGAGFRTVVVEAGPQVPVAAMRQEAPRFLSRYYWEGGMRLILGSSAVPSMQGRCLGGSTVVNSAIMLKLPDWVRATWAAEDGLDDIMWDPALDRGFERAFQRCQVAPTPMTVLGKRNLLIRDALAARRIQGYPLPRAVSGCQGCGTCITGCATGAKQSMDRAVLPAATQAGAAIYTCAAVDRVTTTGSRVTGVTGDIVDPVGRRRLSRFRVRAPLVVMAAGVMATPVILLKSRINPRKTVGSSLQMHLTCGVVGVFDEVVDPWRGATQGWGALSPTIRGLKYESLWAPPSLIATSWGGLGRRYLQDIQAMKHATVGALVYRGQVTGSVWAKRNGYPRMRIYTPKREVHVLMRGLKELIDGLFAVGARYVMPSMSMIPQRLNSPQEAEIVLSRKIGPKHVKMTGNHVFGSCRMSSDPRRGTVDTRGKVHDVDGLYVVDSSIFPSPSAVNPQATVMALADVISRRLAEVAA